ncbi:MAG: sensor histidine kinase [Desulfamplus sp.]|nr:sensor histidine kinase [Desulfamplus sp.]
MYNTGMIHVNNMKNLLKHSPAFMKRLWCQLAVSYTLLTFCAMMLLVVILYGINDYSDFHATLTLDNVEKRVADEKLIIAQAIHDADNAEWLNKVRNNIREKLINLEHGSRTSTYRITNSSRPEMYIQITSRNGYLLMSDPASFPEKIATLFTAQKKLTTVRTSVTWLAENGTIWIDMPIMDDHDGRIGHLHVLYIAEFDFMVQLKSVFDFLFFTWGKVFFLSLPIGIACGFVASRYVTRQLQKMNEVTESWRQGDFKVRIELPSDDVFTRHSWYLNEMAQDLEMYLNLKQSLAVRDERNRMARELHDTVKQKLFALGLQLAIAKAKPVVMEAASEHILEAEAIAREAQKDIKEIITQLRPAGTNDGSLYDRISMIADDFRRRFDLNIELKHSEPVKCNGHTEHHVLRIVQESLMNAVCHGKASEIVIACKIDQEVVILMISDNGRGFDIDQSKEEGGFGIVSMHDRVRDLPHGTFEIKSTAGAGTHIRISWKNEL